MLHFALTFAWIAGLVYATIPIYWLAVHPFAERWRGRKGRVFTPLGGFWLAEIIAAGAITWHWRYETFYSTAWSLLPGGVLAVLDTYLLRKIGSDFGSDRLIGRHELNPQQTDNRLVMTGMHARMRHPIYLAHLIMLLALTVGSGLVVMYCMLVFAVVTGAIMIRAEDAELEKRFGDEYREYRKRVPAIGIGWGHFVLALSIYQIVIYAISLTSESARLRLFYFDPRIGLWFFADDFLGFHSWPGFAVWGSVIIYLALSSKMLRTKMVKQFAVIEGILALVNVSFFALIWVVNMNPSHGFSRVELVIPVIVSAALSWVPLTLAILEMKDRRRVSA